jgi:predicted nucleic acid-binding protein
MRVVADTDLISALFKIGRTDLIYEALAADKIYITQAVFDELAKAPFFYDFVRKVERIELVSVDKISRDIQSAMLGKGESESISYALKTNSILLSNDKKAGEFAEDLGVNVLDIVSFLLLCRDIGILGANDIEHVINMLEKHDYMGFSQEQKRLLMEE